jgi:hypothetical protein
VCVCVCHKSRSESAIHIGTKCAACVYRDANLKCWANSVTIVEKGARRILHMRIHILHSWIRVLRMDPYFTCVNPILHTWIRILHVWIHILRCISVF